MKTFRSALLLSLMIASVLCLSRPASAQLALYGMYGIGNSGVVNTGHIYGPTVGLYDDRGTVINYGADLRAAFLSDGGSTQFDSGLIGPRLAIKPHVIPIDPYGELLVGFVHASYGQGASKSTRNNLAYSANVGLDMTLLPHIDWRVVEFSYTNVINGGITPETFSTGIVVRLP